MRHDPLLGAPELDPRARPLYRMRTVLPDGAVADGQPVHRLVPAEPVSPQVIEHGPVTVERRTLAARLAGALERLVGNFGPVEPEIGGLQIVVFQIRVAAVVDGEPASWIQRNCGTDPAQRIDRFVAGAKREPLRQRLAVDRRRKRPHTQIVRRGIPRAGQADLRQPKNRQRHAGLLREQENLLGCELAPRVAEQADGKRLLHACEVRLHLVVDAPVLELMRKRAEILGEHAHGRGEEQVLETNAQAQFDHVANAERIELANFEVRRREIEVGGEMIDSVDLPAQRVELLDGKTESRLADVADHDVDARVEGFIPDLGLLQGVADALAPMFDVVGSDHAVHRDLRVLLQEIAQEEATDETGRPGQQHLSKFRRRYRGGRRLLADKRAHEPTECVDVSLTMRRQGSDERRHRGVGEGSLGHLFFHGGNSGGMLYTAAAWSRRSACAFTALRNDSRAVSIPSPS